MKRLLLASGLLLTLLVQLDVCASSAPSSTLAPWTASDRLSPTDTSDNVLKKSNASGSTRMTSGIIFPSMFFVKGSYCETVGSSFFSAGFPKDFNLPLVTDVAGANAATIPPGSYHIDVFYKLMDDPSWTRSLTFRVYAMIDSISTPTTSVECVSDTTTHYMDEYIGATVSGHQECDITLTKSSKPRIYVHATDGSHYEACFLGSASIKVTPNPTVLPP